MRSIVVQTSDDNTRVTDPEQERLSSDQELPEEHGVACGRWSCSDEETARNGLGGIAAKPSIRSIVAVGLGALVLVACATVALTGSPSSNADDKPMTLRMLLESPEVHDVSAKNIMKVQTRMLGQSGPSDGIHRAVAEKFMGVSHAIKDVDPDFAHQLDTVTIQKKHHDAVVHMLRYLSDARVESIGIEVAHAIRDSKSEDPEVVKLHIARKLMPLKEELSGLHKEMFPAEVRELMTRNDDGLKELLQPDRMRALKTFDDKWSERLASSPQKEAALVHARQLHFLDATTTKAPLAVALDVVGIIGAIAQEVSVLLRMIKPLTKILPGSKDINLNPVATSAIGAVDAVFNTVSCELDAVQDDDNPLEMATCPMMSGSAAFDMMRSLFTTLNLLGDNKPGNGAQGEHAGAVNSTLAAAAASNHVTCVFYGNCGDTTTTTAAVFR